MRIFTSIGYNRQYRKLSDHQQKLVDAAIDLFKEDPFAPSLDNHALTRQMTGLRSIKAAADLCLIFSVKGQYAEVLFLTVGNHDEVYHR